MKLSFFLIPQYLILLILTSLVLYPFLIKEGLFTIDELGYFYLTKGIWERASLDLSYYFPEFPESNSPLSLVFLAKEGRIHSFYSFGFPLFSSIFYLSFPTLGLQIFNVFLTLLTIILIFFISKKIGGDKKTAFIASTLYLFCTFSLFYAVSLWYHSLITLTFLASLGGVLYYPNRKAIPLFLISSAICIWTAYYMFIPLMILYLYFLLKLEKVEEKLFFLGFFFLVLSFSWAYNDYIYSKPFTSYPYYLPHQIGLISESESYFSLKFLVNLIKRFFFGFIGMFLCRSCVTLAEIWEFSQKSILESSPFLITALPGFLKLYQRKLFTQKLKVISLSYLLYIVMILYGKSHTFGSWELSMRYLLPLIPFLTILGSFYISKFFSYKQLYVILIFFTLFSFFSPLIFFGAWYQLLNFFSIFLIVLFLLFLGARKFNFTFKITLPFLLILMLLFSNFINLNDVKLGNKIRDCSNLLSKSSGRVEVISTFIFKGNFLQGGCEKVVNVALQLSPNEKKKVGLPTS